MGALAQEKNGGFEVVARVTSPDGKETMESKVSGTEHKAIVERLWADLAQQGAENYL
jgi:porphobilinogen deaminase